MAIVSKKLLFDIMRSEECPYWRIADATTTIAENDTDEELESAMQSLSDKLNEIESPFVEVKLCNVTKAVIGKGGNKHKYFLYKVNLSQSSKGTQVAGVGVAGTQQINNEVLKLLKENNELQRKIDRLEDQKKYDQLERKIEGMQREDVITKLLSNPAIMNGISGLFGGKGNIGIASIGEDAPPIETDAIARQQKIKSAIVRLVNVDANFDNTITLLANFAEQNRAQYFESIEMMKTMIQ